MFIDLLKEKISTLDIDQAKTDIEKVIDDWQNLDIRSINYFLRLADMGEIKGVQG